MDRYVCKECGKIFYAFKSANRIFCSLSCAGITKRTFNLTDNAIAYIDGLILGDACIKKVTPRLSQSFSRKYMEWAKIVQIDLNNFGVSSKLSEYDIFDRRTNKTYNLVTLQTLGYKTFKIFRERWYPDGIKIVPKDLILTEKSIRNWYLGDGGYSGKQLKFSTDGFDDSSILYLKQQLNGLGFNPFISTKRIILARNIERERILDIVGELPLCFSHKGTGEI